MNKEKELSIDKVEKSYPVPSGLGRLKILDNVSLHVDKGEIIAILGPSGCGKSTILNIAAGFEKPDEGLVTFDGKQITMPSTERGVVFQSAVLFPWLTVDQNIAYGLKLRRHKRETIERICRTHIEMVGLAGFEGYYPEQLSGGMQQRVALARVLAMEPRMLLMDEPFAALDAQTRIAMQQLLQSISNMLKPTIMFVTHDVEEALILADRIYVMSRLPGRIVREIKVPFERPRKISVVGEAGFAEMKREILELLFQ